jgi:hypothetical protein
MVLVENVGLFYDYNDNEYARKRWATWRLVILLIEDQLVLHDIACRVDLW